MLLDCVLVANKIRVMDSIVYGSEIPVNLDAGDRLRSGAHILEGTAIV